MFELKIKTGNAAFHDLAGGMPDEYAKRGEIRRILSQVEDDIAAGYSSKSCVDLNGNVVGSWEIK